jgi:hypothetical protein
MSSKASTVRIRAVEPSVVVAVVEPVVVPGAGEAEGGAGEVGGVTVGADVAGGVGAGSEGGVCAAAGASVAMVMDAAKARAG